MKLNNLRLISITCIVLALMIIVKSYFGTINSISSNVQKPNSKTSILPMSKEIVENENNSDIKIKLPENDVEVELNYPVSLSYKSKGDIYALRKKYVAKSIFTIPNYEPSNEVFGQIVSGKPWYSIDFCKDLSTNLPKISGISEEARFINNPTMLVAIEYPFLWSNIDDLGFCNSPVNQLIPTRISYSNSKKEITVHYAKFPFDARPPFFYQLNGINANDLGYKYVYVDITKSTYRPLFTNINDNPTNKVQVFNNFIHLGSSCQHNGGCNNGSPRQPNLEFNLKKGEGKGEIFIKLWRKKPISPEQEADIYEKIVIDN